MELGAGCGGHNGAEGLELAIRRIKGDDTKKNFIKDEESYKCMFVKLSIYHPHTWALMDVDRLLLGLQGKSYLQQELTIEFQASGCHTGSVHRIIGGLASPPLPFTIKTINVKGGLLPKDKYRLNFGGPETVADPALCQNSLAPLIQSTTDLKCLPMTDIKFNGIKVTFAKVVFCSYSFDQSVAKMFIELYKSSEMQLRSLAPTISPRALAVDSQQQPPRQRQVHAKEDPAAAQTQEPDRADDCESPMNVASQDDSTHSAVPDNAVRTRCYRLNLNSEIGLTSSQQQHWCLGPFTETPPDLMYASSEDSLDITPTEVAIQTAQIFNGITVSGDGTILSQNERATRSNQDNNKTKRGEKSRQAAKIDAAHDLVEEAATANSNHKEKSQLLSLVVMGEYDDMKHLVRDGAEKLREAEGLPDESLLSYNRFRSAATGHHHSPHHQLQPHQSKTPNANVSRVKLY